MKKEDVILIANDDKEFVELVKTNLFRSGMHNEILHLADGQKLLDFLFDSDKTLEGERDEQEYVLLLDISISGADGVVLLEKIKQDAKLKRTPVIILTATDDPHTIEKCHDLGCSTYLIKPTERKELEKTIQNIGHFLSVVEITSTK